MNSTVWALQLTFLFLFIALTAVNMYDECPLAVSPLWNLLTTTRPDARARACVCVLISRHLICYDTLLEQVNKCNNEQFLLLRPGHIVNKLGTLA